MKTRIRRAASSASAFAIFMSCITACAQTGKPLTDRELRGRGMIVDSRLAKGATQKEGLSGISDAGNEIFSHLRLNPNVFANSTFGGGTNMSFPRWVNVRWRRGPGIHTVPSHEEFAGGTIAGDYTIEVLNRIPEEIFRYANSGPGPCNCIALSRKGRWRTSSLGRAGDSYASKRRTWTCILLARRRFSL